MKINVPHDVISSPKTRKHQGDIIMVLNNYEIFNEKIINVLKKSLNLLSSSDRRKLLGELALEIEHGGKTFIYETFGISRETLNKGVQEVQSGIKCIDNFKNRGRKSYFETQPTIITKIKERNHLAVAESSIPKKSIKR